MKRWFFFLPLLAAPVVFIACAENSPVASETVVLAPRDALFNNDREKMGPPAKLKWTNCGYAGLSDHILRIPPIPGDCPRSVRKRFPKLDGEGYDEEILYLEGVAEGEEYDSQAGEGEGEASAEEVEMRTCGVPLADLERTSKISFDYPAHLECPSVRVKG